MEIISSAKFCNAALAKNKGLSDSQAAAQRDIDEAASTFERSENNSPQQLRKDNA